MQAGQFSLYLFVLLVFFWYNQASDKTASSPPVNEGIERLFDGKTLKNWRVTNFGGQGDVKVEDGQIILGIGNDLTGITWTGDLPRIRLRNQFGGNTSGWQRFLLWYDFSCGGRLLFANPWWLGRNRSRSFQYRRSRCF